MCTGWRPGRRGDRAGACGAGAGAHSGGAAAQVGREGANGRASCGLSAACKRFQTLLGCLCLEVQFRAAGACRLAVHAGPCAQLLADPPALASFACPVSGTTSSRSRPCWAAPRCGRQLLLGHVCMCALHVRQTNCRVLPPHLLPPHLTTYWRPLCCSTRRSLTLAAAACTSPPASSRGEQAKGRFCGEDQ